MMATQFAINKNDRHSASRSRSYGSGRRRIRARARKISEPRRMPWLESRALERNAACYSLFVVFMLIPVARFWNRPVRMFSSGVLAWTMFVVAYDIAGFFFRNLFQILRSPFEALIEGILAYGVLAVVAWVGGMALLARLTPIAPRRRKSDVFRAHEQ